VSGAAASPPAADARPEHHEGGLEATARALRHGPRGALRCTAGGRAYPSTTRPRRRPRHGGREGATARSSACRPPLRLRELRTVGKTGESSNGQQPRHDSCSPRPRLEPTRRARQVARRDELGCANSRQAAPARFHASLLLLLVACLLEGRGLALLGTSGQALRRQQHQQHQHQQSALFTMPRRALAAGCGARGARTGAGGSRGVRRARRRARARGSSGARRPFRPCRQPEPRRLLCRRARLRVRGVRWV
jgi:hypothetical protein